MLVRMYPEQANKAWDVLAPMIAVTLPPAMRVTRTALVNILKAILFNEAQCWVFKDDEDSRPKMFVLTAAVYDGLSGINRLVIYSSFAIETLTRDEYLELISTLKRYGEHRRCYELVTYAEDTALNVLEEIGGKKLSNFVRL